MLKRMTGLCMALLVVGTCGLLTGCSGGPKPDPAKEPNKDLKAGPPTADPQTLEEIRKHSPQGQQTGGQN